MGMTLCSLTSSISTMFPVNPEFLKNFEFPKKIPKGPENCLDKI